MSRKIKIFLALAVIVAGGYFAGSRLGLSSNGGVPAEFKDARLRGAIIAQDIVNLSNGMSGELDEINKLDQEGNFAEALNKSAALIARTQEVRGRAIELSAELEKMTGALTHIDSQDARQAALESITNRMALISRLLSYNEYLTQLLNSLNVKFSGQSLQKDHVKNLIAQVNAEVTAINSFNTQAALAMDKFDEVLRSAE